MLRSNYLTSLLITMTILVMVPSAYDILAAPVSCNPSVPCDGTNENDVMKGTDQADEMNGLDGNDKMSGNAGQDGFFCGDGTDKVDDFNPNEDHIPNADCEIQ